MSAYSKIVVALGKMRYRVLVYLSISVIVYVLAFTSGSALVFDILSYINWAGTISLLLLYGHGSAGSGGGGPIGILPEMIVTLGLFIEIFIVCEFIIALKKR
jgi:hypothetical protein